MLKNILEFLCTNTVCATVLSGSIVFIIGQVFLEIFIKPWEKYKNTKSKVVFFLYRYRECIYNPISRKNYLAYIDSEEERLREFGQMYREAQTNAKDLAAELSEFLENRGICFLIPCKKRIRVAVDRLFWLSEYMIENSEDIVQNNSIKIYREITESLRLYGVEKWKKHK